MRKLAHDIAPACIVNSACVSFGNRGWFENHQATSTYLQIIFPKSTPFLSPIQSEHGNEDFGQIFAQNKNRDTFDHIDAEMADHCPEYKDLLELHCYFGIVNYLSQYTVDEKNTSRYKTWYYK